MNSFVKPKVFPLLAGTQDDETVRELRLKKLSVTDEYVDEPAAMSRDALRERLLMSRRE